MSYESTGYDQMACQFSPDGRIFQVEYAKKALLISGTIIGLRGKDCVVLAAERIPSSKLYEPSAFDRIFSADWHIGVAIAGYVPDGKHLLQAARNEATTYKLQYKEDIPLGRLKNRLAMYMNDYTHFGALRPFGAGLILASCEAGPELFCIEPCGTAYGYFGCAMGKSKDAAVTEIEKLDLKNLSSKELVKEAAKILYMIRDGRDKLFELELSWVGKNTQGKHLKVPEVMLQEAEAYAKACVEERDFEE